jgi:TonB family protein
MLAPLGLLLGVILALPAGAIAQNSSPDQEPPPASAAPGNSQSPTPPPSIGGASQKYPGVYRVGGGVSAPKVIYAPDPEYSEEARKARYQGTEVLWLVVDAEGIPQNIRVQRSLGMGLDEEALKAVKRWRFDPARKAGQPVAVMINVEINFRLYEILSPHPQSAEQPPHFPGVDTAKYPLVVRVNKLSFVGSGPDATATDKALLTDAGQQQDVTISCIVDSPQCLNLLVGAYPARWQGSRKTLEILGLSSKGEWKPAEYGVAGQ